MVAMNMTEFRRHQEDLRERVQRQPKRSLLRRRLERELRGLVVSELRREVVPGLQPVPEHPEDDEHQLRYYQK